MAGASLYDLSAAYRAIFDAAIDAETGEVTDEALSAQLDAIGDSLAAKVDAVCKLRAAAKARSVGVKAEMQRLKRMADAADHLAERLETLVERALLASGQRELRGDLFTARIQANNPSVVIVDAAELPPKFVVVETRPDKVAIAKALKAGEEVPGARLERTESVRIK